ncbi:FIST signal transduction protein [Leptolyngbya sp. AN02str]|uniref:FIST signal transduction protein n=1 Tax=Leptolyngbya sp. AN02str TaxID=3423363 RepID=UPI003D324500
MPEATPGRMKWASALSTKPSLEAAVKEVVEQAQQRLQASADLALVFISSAFASEYSRLMPLLKEHLSVSALIGCSGGGVVGVDGSGGICELEDEAALTLSLAHLPGVNVQTFHLVEEDLPDLDSPPNRWSDLIGVPPEDRPHFILLSDSLSSETRDLLPGLDYAYPEAVKIGGMATSSSMSGNGLFRDFEFYREGTVGVALSGNVVLEAIVAQGCRPIGHPYRVIEGERNIMLKLEQQDESGEANDGEICTPLEALQSLYQDLDDDEQELAQNSLFIGVAQSEFKMRLEQGDFLIRTMLGVDPRVGAIAIGDRVRPGQRIQFHLRDADASAEDLEMLLQRYRQQHVGSSPAGALMFTCVGRGEGLYDEPNFDSKLFSQFIPNVPLSGFFCGGEIGPVGNSTFIHGYTSVFGICREP